MAMAWNGPEDGARLLLPGYLGSALLAALLVVLMAVCLIRARRGQRLPQLRRLPGVKVLEEMVGRATEMGRPVHMTPGTDDPRNAQVLASFPILRQLALAAARYDTPLLHTSADQIVYALSDATIQQSYIEAGRPAGYDPENVRYLSDNAFAYAAGVMGIFRRERPAANVMFGNFGAEALLLIEAGVEAGSLQLAATSNIFQLPFFVAGCDYTLIGEEMYVAAASVSGDPVLRSTVIAQDWMRLVVALLVLAGAILHTLAGPADPLRRWLQR
jgi:hypothetical protein